MKTLKGTALTAFALVTMASSAFAGEKCVVKGDNNDVYNFETGTREIKASKLGLITVGSESFNVANIQGKTLIVKKYTELSKACQKKYELSTLFNDPRLAPAIMKVLKKHGFKPSKPAVKKVEDSVKICISEWIPNSTKRKYLPKGCNKAFKTSAKKPKSVKPNHKVKVCMSEWIPGSTERKYTPKGCNK